ncbi:hypothetical protein L9F63_022113, partial [Diploptera punctata]
KPTRFAIPIIDLYKTFVLEFVDMIKGDNNINVYGGAVLCIFAIIIRFLVLIRNLNLPLIYKRLAEFDTKILLMYYLRTISYNCKNYKICYLFCIVLLTPYYMITIISQFSVAMSKEFNSITILTIFNFWPFVTVDVLYPTIILGLWWRFRALNSKIETFIEYFENNTLKHVMLTDINNFEFNSISILNLRILYDSLTEICKLANSSFSIPVLICIALKFISLTFKLYIFVSRSLSNKYFLGTFDIQFVFTIIYSISNIILTIWFTTAVASEANRTGVLVHKLLNKVNDSRVKEELELFSMQLLHQKVQFTACGFFPLDFTLLHSIIGAVTTYLIILIQFQLTFSDHLNGTVCILSNHTSTF